MATQPAKNVTLELTPKEVNQLIAAIDVKKAQLQRAANVEQEQEVKELRIKQHADYNQLQLKISTPDLYK